MDVMNRPVATVLASCRRRRFDRRRPTREPSPDAETGDVSITQHAWRTPKRGRHRAFPDDPNYGLRADPGVVGPFMPALEGRWEWYGRGGRKGKRKQAQVVPDISSVGCATDQPMAALLGRLIAAKASIIDPELWLAATRSGAIKQAQREILGK